MQENLQAVTRSAARWLPAALLPSRIPAGCSAGRFNRQPQFREQPKGPALSSGSTACSATSPGDYRQEADAGVHRQGDLHGVAVPPGCARRRRLRSWPTNSANTVPCMMPYIDRLLYAARSGRPPGCGARGRRELCLPGPVRRDRRATPSSPLSIPSAPVWRLFTPC